MDVVYPGCSHPGLANGGDHRDGLTIRRYHHEPGACGAFKKLGVKAREVADLCLSGDQDGIESGLTHQLLDSLRSAAQTLLAQTLGGCCRS